MYKLAPVVRDVIKCIAYVEYLDGAVFKKDKKLPKTKSRKVVF